ncbi:MAG: hypothetical protein SFW08_08365 [Gemmatimonadaceae bacterium]|nr:hypothetical protein [Gemmatimonadaceae bacterium]
MECNAWIRARVRRTASRLASLAMLSAALLATAAAEGRAQLTGAGFLFQPPTATLTIRTGFGAPLARSDIFDFAAEQLTFERRKLSGISAGLDVGGFLSPRVELMLSGDIQSRVAPTEYREWQESNGAPITQQTRLMRVPLTIGTKLYLNAPGEQIGKFAWIPTKVSAYVGGGVGMTWYRFRQEGDFVDLNAGNNIFTDVFESEGWAPTAMGLAGVDVALSSTASISTQLRGTFARKSLSSRFTGFAPIDLSGVSLMVGLTLRAQ